MRPGCGARLGASPHPRSHARRRNALTPFAQDASLSAEAPPLCVVLSVPLAQAAQAVARALKVRVSSRVLSPDAALLSRVRPQAHPACPRCSVLCSVSEDAQGRGAYSAAASAFARHLPPLDGWGTADGWHGAAEALSGEEEGSEGESAGQEEPAAAPKAKRILVRHLPLSFAPLGTQQLTLPEDSYAAEAPVAPPGVLTAAGLLPLGSPLGDEEQRLAPPAGVAAHASALAALGASLGVSWDCFALGESAAAVARCVAAHPSGTHAGGAHRVAALLLLDRGCDLATPALPASDSLLLALDQLPARHRRSGCDGCDALTDALGMSRLAALGGGCGSWTERARQLDAQLGRRMRDGAMACRKQLLEALRGCGCAPASRPRLGSCEGGELRSLALQLRDASSRAPPRRHAHAVAHALAVADALDAAVVGASEAGAAATLAAAAAAGGATAVAHSLLALAADARLTDDQLPALLLAGYALAGDAAGAEGEEGGAAAALGPLPPVLERQLKDHLVARQLAAAPAGTAPADARARVDARLGRLRALGGARRHLRAAAAAAAQRGRAAPTVHAPQGALPGLLKALAARLAAREEVEEVRKACVC